MYQACLLKPFRLGGLSVLRPNTQRETHAAWLHATRGLLDQRYVKFMLYADFQTSPSKILPQTCKRGCGKFSQSWDQGVSQVTCKWIILQPSLHTAFFAFFFYHFLEERRFDTRKHENIAVDVAKSDGDEENRKGNESAKDSQCWQSFTCPDDESSNTE